jgi:DNA polymerase-1
MTFKTLKNAQQIAEFCEQLARTPHTGYDTETTTLDPHTGELRLLQLSMPENGDVGIVDVRDFPELDKNPALAPVRDLLTNRGVVKIMHNAKFDMKWTARHLGVEIEGVYDSLLASQIISCGNPNDRHGLGFVVERFLGEEVDKTEQKSDWSANELSPVQLEYAAKDARILHPLREKQIESLKAEGLIKAAQIEFECVLAMAMMELAGFYLDEKRWLEQLETVSRRQASAADELQDLLSAGVLQTGLFGRVEINLDSNPQVLSALQNIGVPTEAIDKNVLLPLADRFPVCGKVVEYRAALKQSSSYGLNILDARHPATKRLHADFRQIGAPTGRMACTKPNIQQIPNDPVYRRCFTAPEGRKLVIADFSQVELRILAHITGDPQFIEGFNSGRDFHTATAAMVFKQAYDEVSPELRTFTKRINFGIAYGISKFRLSAMCGISLERADEIIRSWLRTFRYVDRHLKSHGRQVLENGYATSLSGRKAKYKYIEGDFKSESATIREGNNMQIQGTSADITKIAAALAHRAFRGTSARIVNIVHDEIIVEAAADEAKSAAETLTKSMEAAGNVYVNKVKVTADAKIASSWAEK